MNSKKKLGIIGGMGSRAGAIFLKKIIDYSPAITDQDFPEIIFHNNSAAPDRTRAIIYQEPSPLYAILRSVELFNRNEVEIMALACITSYYYYHQIRAQASSLVVNPLHLVAEWIKNEPRGFQRIGLLATTGTINTGLFQKALNKCEAEIITLAPDEQENIFMRSVYMNGGLKSANITELARHLMQKSVDKLLEARVDLIIGGCTEVSVGIDPCAVPVPFLDTLDLLAIKTVEYCYNPALTHINAEMYE